MEISFSILYCRMTHQVVTKDFFRFTQGLVNAWENKHINEVQT